ncbi:hypothetical protein MesoLj113c_63730 [Mesorhizobium sp. 113-3-9]|uniref:hypothetical protein n=1 Tax=Mesorhizobium sp. 113-3-9 TaxID=2744517 RepID=UPI00192737C3|nr:hypothetical protein [Mesorhizobium sp. 113-3-9]BCG90263.1 hypothetical protein MesoLj113c_63730 [Mesorhizobium sp. 113-3-9]
MLFARKAKDTPGMTLEGVLGPNHRLDDADAIPVEKPEALSVSAEGHLLFSSGSQIFRLHRWRDAPEAWTRFDQPVSALSCSADGLVAVGLQGGSIAVVDQSGQAVDGWSAPQDLVSVSDCAFLSSDEIAVVDNGYRDDQNVLSIAPWDEVPRGKVVVVGRFKEPRIVARALHCPMGITPDFAGGLIVSQLDRASIVDLSGRTLQSGYPGYLGRIRKTDTGYAMACLSRRDPLIEFLKTEPVFVSDMKANLDPRYWISPRATPEISHDFPIELGAARLFGDVKPWAPSFSYGLVIELDEALMPIACAHSRANGRRHAICDVCSWNKNLIAVSRASGEILNLGSGSVP